MRRIRVANVVTRMSAGAGGVVLRGALGLDAEVYDTTIITGATGLDGGSNGSRDPGHGVPEPPVFEGADAVADPSVGDLLGEAYAAGLTVIRVPDLVPRPAAVRDLAAQRVLADLLADGGYDVVHTHTAKAGALGRIAAARTGVGRIVHTYHGFPFHPFQPAWRRASYVAAERWLGRRTDAFLAVGEAVAAEAVRRGLAPPDRIRAVLPPVDPVHRPAGAAARERARARLGLPDGVRVVGTVGRVDYQKAPEQWLDAVATAGPDVWAVWIGDGPLADRLARSGVRRLAERFRWLGHRTDVAELLPGFDVFALASRYEGLPRALVEAMYARVPVAATAVNAVPELVVPGETGMLAAPSDPHRLGRAIGHLLDHPGQARLMADTAASRLGDRFTPELLGEVLDRTYRAVDASPARSSRARRPPQSPE